MGMFLGRDKHAFLYMGLPPRNQLIFDALFQFLPVQLGRHLGVLSPEAIAITVPVQSSSYTRQQRFLQVSSPQRIAESLEHQ
jgi:hypothetical protein